MILSFSRRSNDRPSTFAALQNAGVRCPKQNYRGQRNGHSQSFNFDILPEPVDPGVKERTFDAGILIESFGGALGVDRSFAFLRVRPSGISNRAGKADKIREWESHESLVTASNPAAMTDVLASSDADGETEVRTPS